MTAKDKAKELVDRFYDTIENNVELYKGEYLVTAKQCALVCVDRMLESLWRVGHSFCNDEIKYLKEVKEEIEKLFIPDVVKPFFCLKKPTVIGPQKCDKQCSYCKMEESLQ